jgi:hypothetical protein
MFGRIATAATLGAQTQVTGEERQIQLQRREIARLRQQMEAE